MSRQRIVLSWNGSLPKEYKKARTYPVKLATPQRRLRFGLHTLLQQIAIQDRKPDPRTLELALVALAVWIADTRLARAQFSEDNWTREIDIVVPVRDADAWNAQAPPLARILGTLSGDIWRVRFYRAGRELRNYMKVMCADMEKRKDAPTTALFSGGLDSYAGAIDLLSREQIAPIFVSQTDGGNSSTVDGLKALLEKHRNHDITLLRWKVSSIATDLGDKFSGDGELTMRARSFLFFAASVLVASAFGSSKVAVPENGFISLNVPLDPWRLGALTTRTTHPFVLARFNDLLESLGLPVRLDNPFQGRTKGEMLAQCVDQDLLWEGLASTVSCSKPKWVRRYRAQYGSSHCGTCWPCLIRRAAIRHAFPKVDDPTPYLVQKLTHLPTEPGEAGHLVRSIQYGLNMLRQTDQHLRLTMATVASLRDVQAAIPDLVGCVRRGLTEVAHVTGLPVPS